MATDEPLEGSSLPPPAPWRPLLGMGWTERLLCVTRGLGQGVWSPVVWAFMSFDWGGGPGVGRRTLGWEPVVSTLVPAL